MLTLIGKILVGIAVVAALVGATQFGWRPTRAFRPVLTAGQRESARRLRAVVETLAGEIGSRNYSEPGSLRAAAEFIEAEFRKAGYEPQRMTYTVRGREFANIIADMPGAGPAGQVFILGAHYDSCFNPGADDNASGVAGLLEIARALRDVNPAINVRFVAFVNEEPPFFMTDDMGSRVYARQMREQGEKIAGVVILEMIGYFRDQPFSQKYLPLFGPFFPNRGNFLAFVGNFASRDLTGRLFAAFRRSAGGPAEKLCAPSGLPGPNFSDHWSFWQEGYPAVMVTDTAYLRNPHYHADGDLPETLDYARMAVAVSALADALSSPRLGGGNRRPVPEN